MSVSSKGTWTTHYTATPETSLVTWPETKQKKGNRFDENQIYLISRLILKIPKICWLC